MSQKLFVLLVALVVGIALISQFILKHRTAPVAVAIENVKVVGNGMLALHVNPSQPLRIGIIGETRGDVSTAEAFNQEVLVKLVEMLKRKKVQAIFFTGDMVMGWTKLTAELKAAGSGAKPPPIYMPDRSLAGDKEIAKKYISNAQSLKEQLDSFTKVLHETVGHQQIAFFPLMGTHEAIGPDAAQIFRQEFHLESSAPFDPHAVAYTVSAGDAFFVVISTDYYSPSGETLVSHHLSPELMRWVEQMLQAGAKTHKYLFVMGHEPAFSTASIFSGYPGLDDDQSQRDFFWGLLKEYGVLAYFSSQERLYDRSNRQGVWQIVSGGGGAPLEAKGGSNAFYHSLLLTIPPAGSADAPKVEALDLNGDVVDAFELRPQQQPLHQLRIQ